MIERMKDPSLSYAPEALSIHLQHLRKRREEELADTREAVDSRTDTGEDHEARDARERHGRRESTRTGDSRVMSPA